MSEYNVITPNEIRNALPKWHQELDIFRKIKPCLIIEGNILDRYLYPLDGDMQGAPVRLTEYLYYYFQSAGYENIVLYDSIQGFSNPYDTESINRFGTLISASVNEQGFIEARFGDRQHNSAARLIKTAVLQTKSPTVIIMDFASRYIPEPNHLDQADVDGFTILMQATLDSADACSESGIRKNLVILLVNKLNDIPAWFYLNNPNVKPIFLHTPSKEEREDMIKGENFSYFFKPEIYDSESQYYTEHADELEKIQDRLVALTEGFTYTELCGLQLLSTDQGTHIRDICSIIDLYKFGKKDNPWTKVDLDNAYEHFETRVKGQRLALTQTLDIVKRAITGMADITSSTHGKPKGVLFFAGPTGTGKTETAKTLAQEIFGDESACIRFDMSEFSQPHSDARLLGAPPGYVGYESGGELTNAVKKNPFCILLFDEIEKAHGSILDKFLQILEDGRMTDGKGETVYFSESIIIFTSNLGIYELDNNGIRHQVVDSKKSYPEVQELVRNGINDYFKLRLGRPEILNRIGENIVVFDYIRPDVAEEILRSQLKKIANNVRANKNIDLIISDNVFSILRDKALANLDNGGRGIGNVVESMFVNPLSRYMFDKKKLQNCRIEVIDIKTNEMPYTIICS